MSISGLSSQNLSQLTQLMRSQSSGSMSRQDPLAALADSSGNVSKESFISNRPKDVTEEQATSLWNSIDTQSTGSVSLSTLKDGMKKQGPNGSPPPKPPEGQNQSALTGAQSQTLDSSTINSLIKALQDLTSNLTSSDTQSTSTSTNTQTDPFSAMADENGMISQEAFVSNRPSDVTAEMANNLWASMDTDGTGSLSADSVKSSMEANRPKGHPPGGQPMGPPPTEGSGDASNGSGSDTSNSTNIQALISALQTYLQASGYGSDNSSGTSSSDTQLSLSA